MRAEDGSLPSGQAEAHTAQAKAQADRLMADTKTELERHRAAAQREVDELNRQRTSSRPASNSYARCSAGRHLPSAPSRGRPAHCL